MHFITIFNDLLSSKSDIKKQMHKVLGAKNKNIFHGLNVTWLAIKSSVKYALVARLGHSK